jgi:hypothetical protein
MDELEHILIKVKEASHRKHFIYSHSHEMSRIRTSIETGSTILWPGPGGGDMKEQGDGNEKVQISI